MTSCSIVRKRGIKMDCSVTSRKKVDPQNKAIM